ncbi:helix-turn-helix transcriptional regulator [Chryseobacterium manosquense]|uniref:Helix-turn-helix transcriptional regulator n=1 Tax=Chryseobacterium manosquense TaxID=2754694 RepID=A0A7H1DT95_9FLAO|nr:helix-turn-helix transcriptional regulator [Chryseobacterium manosquense]QNS40203.1 helix-turn-helix transcriptional regulator [Chryseobacterium manosquense]
MQVKKLLQLYGGTQKEMAAALGVTQPRISEYITGKKNISVKRLQTWCDILKIDIKELF